MNILSIASITDVAELISAFAAILTVGLAFVELSSRSKAKKADLAMDIYSDYLHIKQQLIYAVENVGSYAQNIAAYTELELSAFVQTHNIDSSVFATIQKLSKESISSFECLKDEGKRNSKLILDFCAGVTDLLLYINAFFKANSHGGPYDIEKIKKSHRYVLTTYQKLIPSIDTAGETLNKNLIKTHSRSNLYLATLFLAAVVCLLICFFL